MASTFQRPDMDAIIAACDDFVFINIKRAQVGKPNWTLPCEKLTLPWHFSRQVNGSAKFMATRRRD